MITALVVDMHDESSYDCLIPFSMFMAVLSWFYGTSTVEDDELLKLLAIFGGGTPPPCGCDLRDMFNIPKSSVKLTTSTYLSMRFNVSLINIVYDKI